MSAPAFQREVEKIRGIRVYSPLAEIDEPVDMVEVVRRSEALYGSAQEAIDIGAKILWAQIGVYD